LRPLIFGDRGSTNPLNKMTCRLRSQSSPWRCMSLVCWGKTRQPRTRKLLKQIKCIRDDTKAAARQSLNCIKNKKINMAKNDFQYDGWNSYTLQCGMLLWNRDSEFTKWQHFEMWYVALGWHAIEFTQTSAILEFYIWFPFPHITAVDMSFCTKSEHPRQKNHVMSIFKMEYRSPVMLT